VVAALVVPALALSALTAEAGAQLPGVSGAITLQEALDAALLHSTQLRLGERQVQSAAGALLAARAPFDAQLNTSIATEREQSVSPTGAGTTARLLTRTVMYRVAVPKRFRSGVSIAPRGDLTRAEATNVPDAITSRASVELTLLIPLLRDRGGVVTAAPERAAKRSYDASVLEARHAAAASILGVVTAYWNELAAEQRLDAYRASESRARQLVGDTRKLVEADERPAADLQQLLANLALKRAARLTGEQATVEARQQLALAMGVYDAGEAALPRAMASFPEVPSDTDGPGSGDESDVAAALRRRADLAALAARRSAAEVQLSAARRGSKPGLDLAVGLGYEGFAAERGVDGALSSLYRNVPGLNASVQLSYDLPLSRLAARGDALRSAAAYDQARIRETDLAHQIASGVFVAGAALRHGRLALLASREAVTLSRQAVENEKRKFQLGMSTLFDVILAGDALTNARLAEIAAQRDYAVAIARLRYETGAILIADGLRPSASASSMEKEP
jgi:outer membrane protein TolC